MKRALAMALPAAVAALGPVLPAAAQQQRSGQVTIRADPPQSVPTPPPAEYPLAVQDRFARARDNLAALRDGRVAVSELTAIELQDVLDLDRALREQGGEFRTPQQQCIEDEVRRAAGQPSELEWKVIDLKCRP